MKEAVLKLIKCALVPVGAACSLARSGRRVAILMYHRVNDGVNKEISVRAADFRWQMEYLRRKGYAVISLDEALRLGGGEKGKRRRYAVLTFDDGYEDFIHHAYPVLQEYGYPALVYLVPGCMETNGVFWWDEGLGESRLMDWRQAEALRDGGLVRFGSHTLTHADLDQLDEEATVRELEESREALEHRLGMEIRHFAYPRGIVTGRAMEAARALYDTAASIFEGDELIPGGAPPDPMRLKRAPVQRSDGRLLFGARLLGWLEPEGWLKKAMGRH